MASVLDCNIAESKFKLQLHFYIHFWTNILEKSMDSLSSHPSYGLVPLLFFYKDDFGIKLFMNLDMPLNKEAKPNINKCPYWIIHKELICC